MQNVRNMEIKHKHRMKAQLIAALNDQEKSEQEYKQDNNEYVFNKYTIINKTCKIGKKIKMQISSVTDVTNVVTATEHTQNNINIGQNIIAQ